MDWMQINPVLQHVHGLQLKHINHIRIMIITNVYRHALQILQLLQMTHQNNVLQFVLLQIMLTKKLDHVFRFVQVVHMVSKTPVLEFV